MHPVELKLTCSNNFHFSLSVNTVAKYSQILEVISVIYAFTQVSNRFGANTVRGNSLV